MMPMPQSPPPPPADDEQALALLLKAIDSLEAAERTEVLMFLLKRGLGVAQPAEPGLFTSVGSSVQAPGQGGRLTALLGGGNAITFSRPTGEGQQMVPVRFSTDSHQRLRTWCGENGFPMAAVVRGLVDQFLDGRA